MYLDYSRELILGAYSGILLFLVVLSTISLERPDSNSTLMPAHDTF